MTDADRPRRDELRVEDPSLSPEANRLLSEELRRAVAADEQARPDAAPRRASHGGRSGLTVALASNRLLLAMTALGALVVGGVAALATGSWWLLPLALALHAVGTLVVLAVVLQLTTQTEHVAPEVAARLEEEGVADPDATLSDLVDHEHRRKVTPTHDDTKPVGP